MLERILAFSLTHRGFVLAGALALTIGGVASFRALPIDAFPDTTPVMVQINTPAPGWAPEEIEAQVTFPLEQGISGLPKLREVRSLSKFGLSQVTVLFEDGFDILRARQLVSERLQTVQLPAVPGLGPAQLGPIATGLGEVYHYLVTSDRHSLEELRTIHHWVVKAQLRTVAGVAEVNSWGGYEKQYHVLFDPAKLMKYDLHLDDLVESLRANNANVGGGVIQHASEVELVQGVGLVTSAPQIADIVLKSHHGQPVRVRDVASVEIGHEIPAGAVTAQGRGPAILGLGFMLMGENSRDVTERLRTKMEQIRPALPEGVQIQEVYARTRLVDQVLETARDNLLHGAVLVVAALFALGGSVRAGLIVATAIPLSFLFAGNLMLQAGVIGSLMSLGAIDFGIIIDSSVIMVENSVRHLAENRGRRPVRDVVLEACAEVRKPSMFGEAIIMIVYLPILTLVGIEGKLFRPMALTVLFALAGSLILSMTVIPVLASLGLSRRTTDHEPLLVRWALAVYRPTLRWVLGHRAAVLAAAAAMLVVCAVLAMRLGGEFIPRLSEHAIVIATLRPASVSLDESVRYGTALEKMLLDKFPHEIEHIWTRTGTAEVATDPMGWDQSDVFITLKPQDAWQRGTTQDELVALMEAEVAGLPGMQALFTQPIEHRINEMIAGVRGDVGVKIYGDDFEQLKRIGEEVAAELRKIPGASEVATDQLTPAPVLRVQVNEEALSRYGVPRRTVLDLIQSIGTMRVGEIREGQRRFPLVVRLAEEFRTDPEAVGRILLPTADGQRLPLADLASIESMGSPAVIFHDWMRRRLLVQCNVRGRDVRSFVTEAQRRVDGLSANWPDNYHAHFGGQFEHLQQAQRRGLMAVPLAGLLIFLMLYWAFGSVRDALLIYSGVPLAVVGGVLGLYFRGLPFSISAGVGFIALCGIAVLNGLVLVSYIHQLTGQGRKLDDAIYQAGEVRLRPVLMTAVVDALGFVPMMLARSIGAEVQRPLATVVVCGVMSSMLLTLVVLPALYSLFGRPEAVETPPPAHGT